MSAYYSQLYGKHTVKKDWESQSIIHLCKSVPKPQLQRDEEVKSLESIAKKCHYENAAGPKTKCLIQQLQHCELTRGANCISRES